MRSATAIGLADDRSLTQGSQVRRRACVRVEVARQDRVLELVAPVRHEAFERADHLVAAGLHVARGQICVRLLRIALVQVAGLELQTPLAQ